MRFGAHGTRQRIVAADVTPMIDVVFLLIVFFMTTSQFAQMTKAPLDLPKEAGVSDRAAGEPAGVVINVTSDGAYSVGGLSVTGARLQAMLAHEFAADAQSPPDLVVRADEGASAAAVNLIVRHLADLGVRGWSLATEPPAGSRAAGGGS